MYWKWSQRYLFLHKCTSLFVHTQWENPCLNWPVFVANIWYQAAFPLHTHIIYITRTHTHTHTHSTHTLTTHTHTIHTPRTHTSLTNAMHTHHSQTPCTHTTSTHAHTLVQYMCMSVEYLPYIKNQFEDKLEFEEKQCRSGRETSARWAGCYWESFKIDYFVFSFVTIVGSIQCVIAWWTVHEFF